MQGQSNGQTAEHLGGGDKHIHGAGMLLRRGDLSLRMSKEKPFWVERTAGAGKPRGHSTVVNPASATSHVVLMPSLGPERQGTSPENSSHTCCAGNQERGSSRSRKGRDPAEPEAQSRGATVSMLFSHPGVCFPQRSGVKSWLQHSSLKAEWRASIQSPATCRAVGGTI